MFVRLCLVCFDIYTETTLADIVMFMLPGDIQLYQPIRAQNQSHQPIAALSPSNQPIRAQCQSYQPIRAESQSYQPITAQSTSNQPIRGEHVDVSEVWEASVLRRAETVSGL